MNSCRFPKLKSVGKFNVNSDKKKVRMVKRGGRLQDAGNK